MIPNPKRYRGTSLIKKTLPPQEPTGALCLGTYGDPREVGVSYERGTPVGQHLALAWKGSGSVCCDDSADVGAICRALSEAGPPPVCPEAGQSLTAPRKVSGGPTSVARELNRSLSRNAK